MTNIRNFIQYKESCPLCNNEILNFHFMSNNNKRVRKVENYLEVQLEVNGFPSSKDKKRFKVNYNIDQDSNDFSVNFLDAVDNSLNFIPLSRFNDCKNFTQNKGIQVYKDCNKCRNYNYSSSHLKFDYAQAILEPFSVKHETVSLTGSFKDGALKRYHVVNNYIDKRTTILYDRFEIENPEQYFSYLNSPPNKNMLDVPLLKIGPKQEMVDKLETIIFFS